MTSADPDDDEDGKRFFAGRGIGRGKGRGLGGGDVFVGPGDAVPLWIPAPRQLRHHYITGETNTSAKFQQFKRCYVATYNLHDIV